MAPWCNVQQCEINCKERSKNDSMAALEESKEAGNEEEALLTGAAKTLCIPNEQTGVEKGKKCFACDTPATCTALWGRSY
jgi:prolyl-tRNA synthetase